MTEEQPDTVRPKWTRPTDIIRVDVAHSRWFIIQRATLLKARHGRLHDIEERYLKKLIEAAEAYEEELRAIIPDL